MNPKTNWIQLLPGWGLPRKMLLERSHPAVVTRVRFMSSAPSSPSSASKPNTEEVAKTQKTGEHDPYAHIPDSPAFFPKLSMNLMGWVKNTRNFVKNYGKRFEEFASDKKRKELHEELYKRSYFADIKGLRINNGKSHVAQDKLLTVDEALPLPNLKVELLNSETINLSRDLKGKVSLLLIGFRDISRTHTKTFETPFLKEFNNNPDVQCLEVAYIDSLIMRNFTRMFIRNMRDDLPPSRHKYFGYAKEGNPQKLQRQLDIINILVGQAYLVDKNGLIRWKAHGTATQFEIETMIKLTTQLCKPK